MGDGQAGIQSIASRVGWPDRAIPYAGAGLIVAHLLSLAIPAMQVTQFFIFKDTISIWSAIEALFGDGEWAIGAVLFAFTVVFPLFKLTAIIHLFAGADLSRGNIEKQLGWLDQFGRWSMLDVLVAALLVVSLTATGLADARFLPGMYLFSVVVVATLLLSHRVGVLARRHSREVDEGATA